MRWSAARRAPNPSGDWLLAPTAGFLERPAAGAHPASERCSESRPTADFSMLHSFSGNDGNDAEATLTPGADGLLLWNDALGRRASNCGTVFNITTAGTFTPLFSFNGANGAMPAASLVQGADEAFYGTTAYGGAGSFGSIFKITPAGTFTSLHSMAQEGLGSNPFGGLVFGPGGILYGSANYGGADGFGLVFQLAPPAFFRRSTISPAMPMMAEIPRQLWRRAKSSEISSARRIARRRCRGRNCLPTHHSLF